MKTNWMNPLSSRRAFTLVELIVVLMILVGLAAVLIPAITDMVARTNRSTSASNIAEVSGAIQRYEAQYMTYPDNWDSLMEDATGTDLGTLMTTLTPLIEDVTLTANTRATLSAAGITTVGVHGDDVGTFAVPTLTALTNTFVLKGLKDTTQEALGLETTGVAGKYIVLGVGSLNDMTGKTMLDAPVHFPRNAATNPETTYARFLAVFQITDGTSAISRAKLVAVIAPDGSTVGTEMDNYFQIAANY